MSSFLLPKVFKLIQGPSDLRFGAWLLMNWLGVSWGLQHSVPENAEYLLSVADELGVVIRPDCEELLFGLWMLLETVELLPFTKPDTDLDQELS